MTRSAEKFSWDDSAAGNFSAVERSDLPFGGEKFDVASYFRTKSEIIEPKLAAAKRDEAAFELDVIVADGADFGTSKSHAANKFFAKIVIKTSTAIDSRGWGGFLGVFGFFHVIIIIA